ncbi:MAG: ABC transporter permease [Anaerolineae bacterium]|jgi:lipopolysaccharide transport system permease protein|nr:ABC transporter permease [Anaerolineae bacterium]
MRDLKLRYKRSVLGLAWSLLNPLLQFLVFAFVFHWVLPLDIENYPVFLFTGLLVWNWFSGALHGGAGVVVDSVELVRYPRFPILLLPLVSVASHWVHFLLALPVLGAFLALAGIGPYWSWLALPLLMLAQFAFILSLVYLLAAAHVFFRDVQYLLGVALLLGFYLSPVFYDSSIVPERFQLLYRLNPVAVLIDAYRSVLLEGQLPPALPLIILLAGALLMIALGLPVFHRASYRFAEEL